MKKVNECKVENCIPTPTSCNFWNGGDVEFLGICDGDPLNNLLWEILNKLKDIAGDDLSSFDIDSLLDVCNKKAPLEVTLLSILNLLKDNDICLKDYINTLSETVSELANQQAVSVNLKCFAQFDNIGNELSVTREDLDQLVIDKLCDHDQRITSLESGQVLLQNEINSINSNQTVDELSISTCIDSNELPTSTQLIKTSKAHCDLEDMTGAPVDIAVAISKVPSTDDSRYNTITGWILNPDNQAEVINNLLLKINNLEERLIFMEDNCCAVTCDDIKLGFTAIFNEDSDGIIIKFTSGAGTSIPLGFEDKGSIITVTDKNGNTSEGVIDIVENFTDNLEYELSVSGLDLTADLDVNITSKIGNDAITCEKCLTKVVKKSNCGFCQICNDGATGELSIVYDDNGGAIAYSSFDPSTTTSTTTTTTVP